MSLWWLDYILLGTFVGFVAGLFGIGGGMTIVPLLLLIFTAQGFPQEHIMHLALGTSMATIVMTSLSSMRAHHSHGAVHWDIVRVMATGLVVGTLGGSFFASMVPTKPLAIIYTLIVCYASVQMVLDTKPKPSRHMPGVLWVFVAGLVIGIASSLIAGGGAFISIPYMVWHNVPMHHAVGTSAALGFPIAVAGTIGYIMAGLKADGLPPYSFGYIYLPAFAGIALMTIVMAPLGARTAHRLPVKKLKRAFGVFLALLALNMVRKLFGL